MSDKAPKLRGVHHVAYRCKDAKETVGFTRNYLRMERDQIKRDALKVEDKEDA